MEKSFLEATRLHSFLEKLRLFGALHGPTVTDAGVTVFAPIADPAELRMDYRRTQIPPKKYLLPFREQLLSYREGRYALPAEAPAAIVLYGVHPCDLAGIAYLDLVFLGDNPDPGYAARRAQLTLVGISCEPDDFCFCSAPDSVANCDAFLTVTKGGYLFSAVTARGKEIAAAAADLLSAADAPRPVAARHQGPSIVPQDPALRFSDHPLWQKFADTCVSCGACSVCCPTCYCFDVREYPALDGAGVRIREWDNCLFATHGEVAGANFRPTRLDRLRYRFLHKYCGFTPLQGITSCVGCGRCKAVCPVDIDLRELFSEADGGTAP
mgnify:CR=1 FL=1